VIWPANFSLEMFKLKLDVGEWTARWRASGRGAEMKSTHRSNLTRALITHVASLALLMMGASGVRADTVIGAGGTPGAFCYGSPSIDESCAINGGDGESVSAGGNPAVATGGNGGAAGDTDDGYVSGDGTGNGGNGGSATAVATGGSIASASATGGAGGYSGLSYGGSGGSAFATSKAFGGSGGASSSAYATGGAALSPGGTGGGSTATATALATRGGLAIALAAATGGEHWIPLGYNGGANSTTTAKSTFAVANVRSTDEAEEAAAYGFSQSTYTVTTNAVAQAGRSGQSFVAPDNSVYAFSTVLPDKAEVAALIGGASTVGSAFLGPEDIVFGTSTLGINGYPDEPAESFTFSENSTFDFRYQGDLLLGLIDGGGDLSVIVNGVQVLADSFTSDTVINLGSDFGPNIDLKIVLEGSGDFILGGAVPEPSTWAMMLVGFAGLGFAGYRSTRKSAVGLGRSGSLHKVSVTFFRWGGWSGSRPRRRAVASATR
jgi:PEP-CTERM motif